MDPKMKPINVCSLTKMLSGVCSRTNKEGLDITLKIKTADGKVEIIDPNDLKDLELDEMKKFLTNIKGVIVEYDFDFEGGDHA